MTNVRRGLDVTEATKVLAALEGCIEGYESLQTKAGLLQCDIFPNILMINEDGKILPGPRS